MAIATTSITEITNNGGGTWKDYGGGGGSSSNADVFVTSTGSRGRKVSNGVKGFAFDMGAGGVDISSSILSIRWATLAGVGALDTRAATTAGVSILVEDTSGNISYWAIDGSDTYGGGWRVSQIDLSLTPTRNSGTAATLTAARYVGIEWNETANVGGGDSNCFIDQILRWPQSGIVVTGNSTTVLEDLVDTIDNGATNGPYDIFERRAGQIFSKVGQIELQPDASDMSDTDTTLLMETYTYYDGTNVDASISTIALKSSDTDSITFTRCDIIASEPDETVTTNSTKNFDFASATDANFNTCKIQGFDGTTMALGGSGNSYDDCTFSRCSQITDTGAVVRRGFVRDTQAAATEAALLWTSSSDWEDVAFVMGSSNSHAIEIETNGLTDNWTGFDFIGYSTSTGPTAVGDEVLINNSTTGTVTINASDIQEEISFRNNGGGATTINNNITVTLTGLQNPTEVRVYLAGTLTVVDGQEDVTTGTFAFSVGVSVAIDIRIFAILYEPVNLLNFSTPTSTTIPIQQRFDRNYNNP